MEEREAGVELSQRGCGKQNLNLPLFYLLVVMTKME